MAPIHKEGQRFLLITLLVLVAVNLFFMYVMPLGGSLQVALTVISVAAFLLILFFFRNPVRLIFANNRHVLAPADGRIVVIEETEESEYFCDKRIQISIFMSPTNVHVNRNPISGRVTYTKYHSGKYLVAWHPKSSVKNERNTVVINNGDGVELLVRQIAGAMARRIVSYLKEGDEVEQGTDLGFIKFGSRVDIFLPLGTKIEVSLHERVKGGETIIATLN